MQLHRGCASASAFDTNMCSILCSHLFLKFHGMVCAPFHFNEWRVWRHCRGQRRRLVVHIWNQATDWTGTQLFLQRQLPGSLDISFSFSISTLSICQFHNCLVYQSFLCLTKPHVCTVASQIARTNERLATMVAGFVWHRTFVVGVLMAWYSTSKFFGPFLQQFFFFVVVTPTRKIA